MKEVPFKLALNSYAYHWSFPEIVADQMGFFGDAGVRIEWSDATPRATTDKHTLYSDLLESGLTDLYHAGEWACIERVLSHPDAGIVARSMPGARTLNSTFALFIRPDSSAKTPGDLSGKKIAIELGTGSYYTVLQDLQRYIPREKINLVQGGEPHKRLLMLYRGEVGAASLLGPWFDLGEALEMRPLLKTKRSAPTTAVVRRSKNRTDLKNFFKAVNRAITVINEGDNKVREIYFERFARVLKELPRELEEAGLSLKENLSVSKWRRWEPYPKEDFERAYRWMLGNKFATAGANYNDVAISRGGEIFRGTR